MAIEYSLSCIPVNPLGCLTYYNPANKFLDMTLGKRLKAAREHAGLTQRELETKSGVLQQMISKIENGHQETSAYIVQLAVACGVRCEWLGIGQGEMTESRVYASNNYEVAALKVMQSLPEYAKPEAIKSLDTIKKLTGGAEESKPESAAQ